MKKKLLLLFLGFGFIACNQYDTYDDHNIIFNSNEEMQSSITHDVNQIGTKCDDLDIVIFSDKVVDGCCIFYLVVNHVNYAEGPRDIDFDVYIDGNILASAGGENNVGTLIPIEVCDQAKVVEVYSNNLLCHSEVLTCQEDDCCYKLGFNTTSYEGDDGCCVYEFKVKDKFDCWEPALAFDFNSDLGPPSSVEWLSNGVIFEICHPEQRIRVFVYEDLTFSTICHATNWFTSNDCKI